MSDATFAVATADLTSAACLVREASASAQSALDTFSAVASTLVEAVRGSEAEQGADTLYRDWCRTIDETARALMTIAIVLERSASHYVAVDAGAAGAITT